MKERAIYIITIVVLLLAIAVGATYYLTTQNQKTIEQLSPAPTATATTTTQPESTEPEAIEETTEEETSVPEGWQTYINDEYGFEISYPENYQALDDANNLYGWPNGIVLIYGGGQSYDLPIEVWDDPSEYENKYQTQMDNLTIEEVGGKYITLLNANQKAEVDQIIATFKTLE